MESIPEGAQRYIDGLLEAPTTQNPADARGDPQRSALAQYLSDRFGPDSSGVVVDFGSGSGVLAFELESVFRDDSPPPEYWAVDLPGPLRSLSLPTEIHNNSRKIEASEFLDDVLPNSAEKIKVVVVRNVLHEMDIDDTAVLISHLVSYLADETELFIQDFEVLPTQEAGCAGWYLESLKAFLREVGFRTSARTHESFSGTMWFAITARRSGGPRSVHDVLERCVSHRSLQLEEMLAELNRLQQESPIKADNLTRFVQLQGDSTAISTQLARIRSSVETPTQEAPRDANITPIPILSDRLDDVQYAVSMDDPHSEVTGLVAILSSKYVIDFPALFRSAKREIAFAGYSQRSLFATDGNRRALAEALNRNCAIKILLVHPDSPAVQARAETAAYEQESDLRRQIQLTIKDTQEFQECMQGDSNASQVEVRTTFRAPPCSYFFVDNLCILSLYSNRATGSRGLCLVFDALRGQLGSYYQFLREEFHTSWYGQ